MAAGLINRSDVALHINEEIKSISQLGSFYELNSTKGNIYKCKVKMVATPLDEVPISFSPVISIPERKLQHTHATFVRGLLNPVSILSLTDIICIVLFYFLFLLGMNSYLLMACLARHILALMMCQIFQSWLAQQRLLTFSSQVFLFSRNTTRKV